MQLELPMLWVDAQHLRFSPILTKVHISCLFVQIKLYCKNHCQRSPSNCSPITKKESRLSSGLKIPNCQSNGSLWLSMTVHPSPVAMRFRNIPLSSSIAFSKFTARILQIITPRVQINSFFIHLLTLTQWVLYQLKRGSIQRSYESVNLWGSI